MLNFHEELQKLSFADSPDLIDLDIYQIEQSWLLERPSLFDMAIGSPKKPATITPAHRVLKLIFEKMED